MQDFGIGNVFKMKIYNKMRTKSTQNKNVNLFTYKFSVSIKFAAVLLAVGAATEASKKFLKRVVLFVVL